MSSIDRITLMDTNNKTEQYYKTLKVDKHLPQIIVPKSRVHMFVDWWNNDIRFEKEIPQTFEEGYVVVEDFFDIPNIDEFSDSIKIIAKTLGTTYNIIKNHLSNFLSSLQSTILYFRFVDANRIYAEAYNKDNRILYRIDFATGNTSEPEDTIDLDILAKDIILANDFSAQNYEDPADKCIKIMSYYHIALLSSCLWYIATSGNHTKYIYENKTPVVTSRSKHIVKVSNIKFVSTPIYDMNKVRVVKVDRLMTRKKGWTYSHSFEVHGHYRHYKNGKVIFIKPFIKGENKEFKAQKIILDPKS